MSENEENYKERQLKAAFADWAVTGRMKYTHVTMVLHVLHFFLPFLPKDSRTLLKTMRTLSAKDMLPGNIITLELSKVVKKPLHRLKPQVL